MRPRIRPRSLVAVLSLVAATVSSTSPAAALDSDEAKGRAQLEVQAVEQGLPKIQGAAARASRARISPARRVAEGDLLLRNKDYARAIHVFHQVVELFEQGKAPASAHADGLYMLAEAYFQDEQYLSARRYFNRLLDHASGSNYGTYAGRSLGRLVDVCLRINDLSGLDDVFARMEQLPTADATGSLQYARGKVYFARGDHAQATASLNGVAPGSRFRHQAQYLLGVVLTKQVAPAAPAHAEPPIGDAEPGAAAAPPSAPAPAPRYDAAIAQFRKTAQIPATTEEQRHVVDLAWMAVGRLYYEMDRHLEAAEAYSHVDRRSPEFSAMLFELAWVYVRLGDHRRAQRALEIQRITDSENLQIADGSLLRADLMLRQGKYEQALAVYEAVRRRYDPIRAQVDRFLAATSDPAVYYDKLVEEQMGAGGGEGSLPPLVVEWAREQARDDRVFAVIDDVTRSRDLIRKSRLMAAKLDAVLRSGTRAKAFPELKASLETTLGLLNKLGLARRVLALGMDDEAGSGVRADLAKVRAERRALMDRMSWLPVTPSDFALREQSGEKQWNKLSQQLQRLTLETDRLQAIVNGLRRILQDAEESGGAPDPATRQRVAQEIAAHERKLLEFRKRIQEYRDAVDASRVQIGFGDQRYVVDRQTRQRFRALLAQEVQLVAAGGDNSGARDYARAIQPVLERAARVEAVLEGIEAQLDQASQTQAAALRAKVAEEAAAIETYAASLDALDQEARLLVGEVAMRNFALVRERLRDIVLRADVGIVQEAWEVREEQRVRVRNLHRERSREEQQLNDELREVLDDAGDDE